MVTSIRTPLFVPANRPERFAKAAASGADAIILDLEDAVADADKDFARAQLTTQIGNVPVIVRVNAVGTPWHVADLQAVADAGFAAVMLPKAETRAMISTLVAALAGTPVIALVESGHGLANAREIAATPGVVRLAFGSVDYCADIGCEHDRDLLLPARSELVLAARLAGIAAPLDGVTLQLDNPAAVLADAAHARAIGMTGKLCIHPRQIDTVHHAFSPTETELAWAHRVIAAGEGSVAVEGQMVDSPVRLRAAAILARAQASR